MNPDTVNSLLSEAAVLEDRAIKLREAAKIMQEMAKTGAAIKAMRKAASDNGILLSAIPPRKPRKPKPVKTGKRKYTKKSSFWKKK